MIHIDYCNYILSSSKWSVSFKWVQLYHQYVDCEFEFDTTLCDKVCRWLTAGGRFFRVSPPNKIDRHDITEVLLKVALNIIALSYCVLKLLVFLLLCLSQFRTLIFNFIYILFNECRREMVVHFIGIGGIDDHHCLNFLFSFLENSLCNKTRNGRYFREHSRMNKNCVLSNPNI